LENESKSQDREDLNNNNSAKVSFSVSDLKTPEDVPDWIELLLYKNTYLF
jgi:hypothetical protein